MGGVLTAAVDAVLARAVVDLTAVVVDTLPAPAERGVIKTTDTRTRRTTTATAIEERDFEMRMITSPDVIRCVRTCQMR